jgi:hypothetical protein
MSQMGVKASTQYIQNSSFDPEFGVLMVEGVGYDGVNLQRVNAQNLQIKSVTSGEYTYFCFSAPGTTEATAKWQVFRLDGNANLMYADGNANYDNAASNPAALSYTYG